MGRVKYIIIKKGGLERAYVFGELDSHREVAYALTRSLDSANPFEHVVSAGFCHFEAIDRFSGGKWKCYGESTSLKVKSREQLDARVLNSQLGGSSDD